METLASYGIPEEGIAYLLGETIGVDISKPTLHKHYAGELQRGPHKINGKAGEYAWRVIERGFREGATAAQQERADKMLWFWLRFHPHSAWRKQQVDMTVAGEVKHTVAGEVQLVPDEQLRAMSTDDITRYYRSRVAAGPAALPAPANDASTCADGEGGAPAAATG